MESIDGHLYERDSPNFRPGIGCEIPALQDGPDRRDIWLTGRVTSGNFLIGRRITGGELSGRREPCACFVALAEYPAPAFRIRMPQVGRARVGQNRAAPLLKQVQLPWISTGY